MRTEYNVSLSVTIETQKRIEGEKHLTGKVIDTSSTKKILDAEQKRENENVNKLVEESIRTCLKVVFDLFLRQLLLQTHCLPKGPNTPVNRSTK
eukprot:9449025-Ditylum_brightwellii.AAC.1